MQFYIFWYKNFNIKIFLVKITILLLYFYFICRCCSHNRRVNRHIWAFWCQPGKGFLNYNINYSYSKFYRVIGSFSNRFKPLHQKTKLKITVLNGCGNETSNVKLIIISSQFILLHHVTFNYLKLKCFRAVQITNKPQ